MRAIFSLDEVAAKHGLTVHEAAAKIGFSNQAIDKIEHGSIKALRLSTIAALCETFAAEPGDFIIVVD